MNLSDATRKGLAERLADCQFHDLIDEERFAYLCDVAFGPGAYNADTREVHHGIKRVPVPLRDTPVLFLDVDGVHRNRDGRAVEAIDAALVFCRLDGWDDDPTRALGDLVPNAHTRFLALLVALRIGAPTR